MLVNKNTYGYSNHKKYVSGRGFVDKMAQILTPALKGLKASDHTLRKIAI